MTAALSVFWSLRYSRLVTYMTSHWSPYVCGCLLEVFISLPDQLSQESGDAGFSGAKSDSD